MHPIKQLTAYPWLESTWQRFAQLQATQNLPHAILLSGVAGLGKQALAQAMVSSQLCANRQPAGAPCGTCQSCHLLQSGAHPDVLMIAPEESGKAIKIEQIRALQAQQALTAHLGDWKVVVIAPAEQMHLSASNSLLKWLEEPPANTLIILVCSAPEALLATIKSRCQQWWVQTPSEAECLAYLDAQGVQLPNADTMRYAYQWAAGAPLALERLLKSSDPETWRAIQSDWHVIQNGQLGDPTQMVARWHNTPATQIIDWLMVLAHAKMQTNAATGGELSTQAWAIWDTLLETKRQLQAPNHYNHTLTLEACVIQIARINAKAL